MYFFTRMRRRSTTAILFLSITPCTLFTQTTVEDRITSIMSKMTIDEKILQLHKEGGMNTADNTRLGIPGFIMADGPHGVRDGLATSFPVGIAMAATWDPELTYRIGIGMGKEFRAKGKHQALGPCFDLDRDPRNGRSAETGGEDPYLCAQISTAVMKGIQSTPCMATIKHYNGNAKENDRYHYNVTISQRWLNEHYGLAFRTAVQQGGTFSVMNAYNLINGQKCAENYNLLSSILKTQWGFPYYVVSDWDSIFDTKNAINAGCDICMGSEKYTNDLPGLVQAGTVSVATIDLAVRRVLRTKILAGLMDYIPAGDPSDINSSENQQLCYEAGKKAIVLLKNEGGILPLDKTKINSVALIGPSANVMQVDGSGSAYVTPFYSVSPRTGLEGKIGAGKINYAKGCDINSTDASGYPAAFAAALASDVVIFCGGLDGGQEGEGLDRVGASTNLPGKQQELINALASLNKNIIVVLFSGGVCNTTNSIANIKGLLYAFYNGQEGGNAVADVLFGDYNPGGRLPETIPQNDLQLAPWTGNDNFNLDWGGGYRWFDKVGSTPQFPFGFGLSYTTFAYSNIVVTPASAVPGEPVTVSVDVTNTGARAGDEVAQLYVTDDAASVPMPVKQLRGFKRVTLGAGEKTTVTFTLTADELYYYDEANLRFDVEPGTFTVRVGGSSNNLPMTGSFRVLDAVKKPDLLITNVRMVPPYPFKGDKVIFLATVKNQGAAPTAAGTVIKANFSVNGVPVSWSDELSTPIPAGGMALICGNKGANGINTWTAVDAGSYTVDARVDPENTVDECVETNNVKSVSLNVYPTPPVNLALRKAVTVSSVENLTYGGSNAVDGSYGTRWSSAFSDPQWIQVDLGAKTYLTDVLLTWEAAYATAYQLQISDDASTWSTVKSITNGMGGAVSISVAANARYIRVYGTKRATAYGYSLYEIEVHGDAPTLVRDGATGTLPDRFILEQNMPNPFNPSTIIRYSVPAASHVRLEVVNVLGQKVAELVDADVAAGVYQAVWHADAASGVYFYRFEAIAAERPTEKFTSIKKMLLMR
jgi:beta-glucosidase